MPEQHGVSELIDRIVRESQIPSARAREELRRELVAHFEEAGQSREAVRAALERSPGRLLAIFVVFSSGAYVAHRIIDRLVAPEYALMGSATTLAVWISTIAILSRFELAFIRRLGAAKVIR